MSVVVLANVDSLDLLVQVDREEKMEPKDLLVQPVLPENEAKLDNLENVDHGVKPANLVNMSLKIKDSSRDHFPVQLMN